MSKKFWQDLAVFLICIFVNCILLETTIRIFHPQRIIPNYYVSAYGIPNALRKNTDMITKEFKPFPPYRVVTNSKHIRSDAEIPYEKSPHEFRIMFLGDSVFHGPGVHYKELFSTLLETYLNETSQKKCYRVINASSPGWGLLEYFLYLKNEGYKYSPDLIVVSKFPDDSRERFSKKISFKDIQWDLTSNGFLKINLIGMQITLSRNSPLNTLWNAIRQSDWYLNLSQTSHLLTLIRFRMSALLNQGFLGDSSGGKSLEEFLRTSGLRFNPRIIWMSESKALKINPQYQPALYFAKQYNADVFTAETDMVLYQVLMQEFLRLASKTKSKTLVLKIPSFIETVGLSRPKYPEWTFAQTDSTQYLDLYEPFFQMQSTKPPFLFFNFNTHWTPGGHLFFAKLLTYYIKNETPFQNLYKLQKESFSWLPQIRQSIANANLRILDFLKKDDYQLFLYGMRLKNKNLFKEAEKKLTQFIQSQKEQYDVYFHLAMVHFQLKNYQKALALLIDAQKSHFLEITKYRRAYQFINNYWEGEKRFNKGEFEEALMFFLKADEIEKSRGLLNNELAAVYGKLNDLSNAEIYYKKEILRRPEWIPSYLNLGSLYFANGYYNQALKQYQKALNLNPNFFITYTLMGMAHFKLGNKETALEMGRKALQIKPGDVFTRNQLKKWGQDLSSVQAQKR